MANANARHAHSNRPDKLPLISNQIWKLNSEVKESEEETEEENYYKKEEKEIGEVIFYLFFLSA